MSRKRRAVATAGAVAPPVVAAPVTSPPPPEAPPSIPGIAVLLAFAVVLLAIPITFIRRAAVQESASFAASDDPKARTAALDAAVGYHFPGSPISRSTIAAWSAHPPSPVAVADLPRLRRLRAAAASVRWLGSPFGAEERTAAESIVRLESVERPGAPPTSAPPRDPSRLATVLLLPALGAFLGGAFLAPRASGLDRRFALLAVAGAAATCVLLALA